MGLIFGTLGGPDFRTAWPGPKGRFKDYGRTAPASFLARDPRSTPSDLAVFSDPSDFGAPPIVHGRSIGRGERPRFVSGPDEIVTRQRGPRRISPGCRKAGGPGLPIVGAGPFLGWCRQRGAGVGGPARRWRTMMMLSPRLKATDPHHGREGGAPARFPGGGFGRVRTLVVGSADMGSSPRRPQGCLELSAAETASWPCLRLGLGRKTRANRSDGNRRPIEALSPGEGAVNEVWRPGQGGPGRSIPRGAGTARPPEPWPTISPTTRLFLTTVHPVQQEPLAGGPAPSPRGSWASGANMAAPSGGRANRVPSPKFSVQLGRHSRHAGFCFRRGPHAGAGPDKICPMCGMISPNYFIFPFLQPSRIFPASLLRGGARGPKMEKRRVGRSNPRGGFGPRFAWNAAVVVSGKTCWGRGRAVFRAEQGGKTEENSEIEGAGARAGPRAPRGHLQLRYFVHHSLFRRCLNWDRREARSPLGPGHHPPLSA